MSIAGVGHSVVLAEDNLFEGLTISGDFYKARFGGINNGPLTNTAVGAITDF